jgi:peptide-methionine (S)-S-oxide reductase
MRFTAFMIMLFACMGVSASFAQSPAPQAAPVAVDAKPRNVILAGGCFWCMEEPFETVDGVLRVQAGYAGGGVHNPTYKQVSSGVTGHMEVVQVTYDPSKVNFPTLLEIYWRNIDPFDTLGQFCDKGDQYKSAIFVESPQERRVAESARDSLRDRFGMPLATEIRDAKEATFYPAEPEHQDYYKKHPIRYKFYRGSCKRDKRLNAVWGDEAGGWHIGPRKQVVK